MKYSFSTIAFVLLLFLVATTAPGCAVEQVPGPEATATVQAVRRVQAGQALGAGIDMEDRSNLSYAKVAYGSGLRYDPKNEDLLARLSQLAWLSGTPTVTPFPTLGPTPAPLPPSDAVPDSELGLRQFGKVILSTLPQRRLIPEPQSRFSPQDQIALYLQALVAKEKDAPFEMRFFDMSTRQLMFVTEPRLKENGLVRWLDSFVWFKSGGMPVGSYRAEIYSLGRLTHLFPFEVTTELTMPTPTPTPAPLPAPTARPAQTPVPAGPRVVSTTPSMDAQGVPGDTPLKAVFDMAVDPKSVNLSSLQLRYSGVGQGGNGGPKPLPGEVSLSSDGRTLSFLPAGGALPGNTTFHASMPAGARSLGGIAMDKPYSWSFSTAAYGPAWDGRLANGDFSLGLEGWNADLAGAATGFGSVDWMQLPEGLGGAAMLSRYPGGGLGGMVGLFENMAFQVPAGQALSLMLGLFGGSGGSSLKYIILGNRGGAAFTKTGSLAEGQVDSWTENRVDLTSGSDPLMPGDVVNRIGFYGEGDEFQYQVKNVRLGDAPGPTPTPTPAPTPAPTALPTQTAAATPGTRDTVSMPGLWMQQVTSYAPGRTTYMVTAEIEYSLVSSPTGVLRLTPYEDESHAGVNWLFELTVRKGSDRVRVSGILIPKPTTQKVRFQAYFRDAAGKHIAEAYSDNYSVQQPAPSR